MIRSWILQLLSIFVFASIGRAQSGVINDNGAPNRRDGYETTHWIQADDFTLTASARLDGVRMWTFEGAGSFQGSITWQIYSNSTSDRPDTLLLSGDASNIVHTATGFILFGYAEYLTTFNIGPVSLPAGVYWLAIHNGPLSNNSDAGRVFWETTDTMSGRPSYSLVAPFTGTWSAHSIVVTSPSDLAFQISGVPAPEVDAITFGDSPRLNFKSTAGQTYRLQTKDTVTDVSWAYSNGPEISGTGGMMDVSDPDSVARSYGKRIYRVRLCPCAVVPGPALSSFKVNNVPQISFTTVFGQSYRVEYKTDPKNPAWTAVSGAETISGTGGVIQVSDNDPELRRSSRRFYRAVMLQN